MADSGLVPPSLTGLRILIVDDSRTIRKTGESLLRKEGFDVRSVGDGLEALQMLAQWVPQIIFMDMMMPRLNGLQACTLILRHPALEHIPVVMLSSKDALIDKVRAQCVGAQAYLTKPFRREELVAVIHRLHPMRDVTLPA